MYKSLRPYRPSPFKLLWKEEFSRQEYWSGLPCPSAGDLPDSGMEPSSPALTGRFFTTEPCGKPQMQVYPQIYSFPSYWWKGPLIISRTDCFLSSQNSRDKETFPLQLSNPEIPPEEKFDWANIDLSKAQFPKIPFSLRQSPDEYNISQSPSFSSPPSHSPEGLMEDGDNHWTATADTCPRCPEHMTPPPHLDEPQDPCLILSRFFWPYYNVKSLCRGNRQARVKSWGT